MMAGGPRERIELEAPLSSDFQPVVRLIIGGIAERVDFAFEDIDDLQLAVERLLAEAGKQRTVRLSFEIAEGRVRALVGPLSERAVADALRDGEVATGALTLKRILQTVVDSFGVEEVSDGGIVVRLEKVKGFG
jgi:anti-sigma regulatory factor (Ser/Thr protein kinase)